MKTRKPMTSNRSLPININYNSSSVAGTVPAPGMAVITPRNKTSVLSSLEEAQSPTTPGSHAAKKQAGQVFPFSPASPAAAAVGGEAARAKFASHQRSSASSISSIGGAIGVGEMVQARKILVDGSTGTIKLSEDTSRRKISTTEDSLDYVNYEPQSQRRDSNRSAGSGVLDEDMQGDYVLMNPVSKVRRTSSGSHQQPKALASNFRPIPSSADQEVMDGPSPQKTLFNRQLSLNVVSESGGKTVDESPYELLRTTSGGGGSGSDLSAMLRGSGKRTNNLGSRPSSVNSDKITSRISNLSLNRPNSANSDRLSTISSSSSSTSTLCGGNSSSSSSTATLCSGVVTTKTSHSPMLMNRVPSDPSSSSTIEDNSASLKSLPKINAASSMDKELHYASLDLPACSAASSSQVSLAPLAKQEADFAKGGRSNDSSANSSATTTPSPNVLSNGQVAAAVMPAFNYAQLDFAKCEAMKQQQ